MTILKQYQLVRIRQLLQSSSEYDGWRINTRPPWIGDVGTLLDVLHADGLPDRYVVECCQTNGKTVWLADFHGDELEPLVDNQCAPSQQAHMIFCRSGRIVLLKRPDVDWHVLQEMYPDYMASFGPWTTNDIASYFIDDYTDDDSKWPFSREVISGYFASSGMELSTE